MKKVLLSLALFSSSCFAVDPYTTVITQYDGSSTQLQRLIPKPANDSVLLYTDATNAISWGLLSGISTTVASGITPASIGAAAASHTHTCSQIVSSSTIGCSILTAANQAAVQAIVGGSTQVNSDWSSTTGVSQILNKPAKYSGVTNGSGVYTVTYGTAYAVKPHIVFSVEGGTNKDSALITSTTTTGFSILVERRTDIVGLLPTYAVVSGLTVNATVTP